MPFLQNDNLYNTQDMPPCILSYHVKVLKGGSSTKKVMLLFV